MARRPGDVSMRLTVRCFQSVLLLHDRNSKFRTSFQDTLRPAGIQPLSLPARSPNPNAFAERWLHAIKSECPSKLILLGKASLRAGYHSVP